MPPNWIASRKEPQPFVSCTLLATIMSAGSIRGRRSLRHSPSSSDHRLTISGFLPMPPISASPVCTPTTTMNSGEIFPTMAPKDDLSGTDPADMDHLLLHAPTWIATPPTPPPKNVRRAVTCLVRRPPSPLSPSVSFPGAGSHNPAPRRPRAISDALLGRSTLPPSEDGTRVNRVSSPETDLGSELDDAWDVAKAKDDVRKYHAVMELLTTEVSYLADLRALFSIYLRHLPTLCRTPSTTFGRGSSSRNSSYTHLPKTSVLSDHGLHPLTTLHAKPKPSARPIFTNSEVDLLTRNAEQVLRLHENFVEELRTAVLPLGFPMELSGIGHLDEKELIRNVDAAVGEVSTKFATEASRFDVYQSFCTGHTEALHLVHRAQHQYPLEWEAYEQHCASLIANVGGDNPDSRPESIHSPEFNRSSNSDSEERQQTTNKLRKRTTSLTSLDGAVRRVRSRANSRDDSSDGGRDKPSRRLAFLDYMIKPIQRICKYPLLLDQLRPDKSLRAMSHPAARPHVHAVVESAAQAMRHVASAVDEARHRAAVKMQSSLIISRIALANPASATSHMSATSSTYPTFQILMPSFLSSLGTCLLAGSLDVMHSQSSKSTSSGTNINAKYLGAFLYLGGYLILVKVTKGKVYEPKHWFPLADFSVVDSEEEDTSLPCTFSLICKGHQFDLTAACQREKDAWLSSIHESRLHPPAWINEPTPSIHCDGKGDLIPSTLDGPFEMMHALPTIQSLPELAKDDGDPQLTESALAPFSQSQNQVCKTEVPSKPEPTHSRRSSSTSVKAIFNPSSDSDTIVIRRSSPTARSQVDQGLQDVISEPILAARSYASTRDELFQAPKVLRASGSFGRSSSALSLTGLTKNRLSRHESVRVPRKKSFGDDGITLSTKTSSRVCQKRRQKKLSIASMPELENILQLPSDLSVSPFSQWSLSMSSFTSPIQSSPASEEHDTVKLRRPSVADKSVPSLTPSPAPSATSQRSNASDLSRTLTQGILKRWTKGSRHRRARSAPHDQNVPVVAAASDDTLIREQSLVEFGAALSLVASPESSEDSAIQPPTRPAELARRMRLLSSGAPVTFRHSSADNTAPRSLSKKGSIFKRLKGLDLGFTSSPTH
ncbi:DH domain-containing protein [Mycena venus]|uniref:DH domain-containing protein n=1 Tax=Mycena venus TaxID=2733690 RepID=A0A8H6Y583_9AGAR|nr:DH domain-containing protein [Mycena venus]